MFLKIVCRNLMLLFLTYCLCSCFSFNGHGQSQRSRQWFSCDDDFYELILKKSNFSQLIFFVKGQNDRYYCTWKMRPTSLDGFLVVDPLMQLPRSLAMHYLSSFLHVQRLVIWIPAVGGKLYYHQPWLAPYHFSHCQKPRNKLFDCLNRVLPL